MREQFKKGGVPWVGFDSVQIGLGGSAPLDIFLAKAIHEPTEEYQKRM